MHSATRASLPGNETGRDIFPDVLSRPDYTGQGLFNLAVSLARICGAPGDANHPELRLPQGGRASEKWEDYEKVVFLLIDGLGDRFLSDNRLLAPHLWCDRIGDISSVFPSTTATAVTTLMTGRPASTHGLLGWFVRDEASDSTIAPLPMRTRGEVPGIPHEAAVGRMLRTASTLGTATCRQTHLVTLDGLTEGAYSEFHSGGAAVHGYTDLEDLPDRVAAAAFSGKGPRYIYAYTPLLDRTAHDHGIDSDASRRILARIDKAYAEIRRRVPDALVVAAADHGFIDNPPERQIDLSDYPELLAMLRAPLSGERRVAYCHTKEAHRETFGHAVNSRFGDSIVAIPAEQALSQGLFGPGEVSAETRARCGDWILIGRDNWIVQDRVEGESCHPMIGVHGGMSEAEMRVPLIVGYP